MNEPCLPFCCQHNAVQRRHACLAQSYSHWWECEHCGIGMHLFNASDPGWDWNWKGQGYFVPDDPPRYRAECTLCKL